MRTDVYKNEQVKVWENSRKLQEHSHYFSFSQYFHLFLQLNGNTENVFFKIFLNTSYFMAQTLSVQISQTFNFQYNAFMLMRRSDNWYILTRVSRAGGIVRRRQLDSNWTSQMVSKSYPLVPRGSKMFRANTDAFLIPCGLSFSLVARQSWWHANRKEMY